MSRFLSSVYEGRVFHQRLRPKKHRLSYKVFSMLLDLDELSELHSQLRLFSHNKFNLFSFWDKDYGPGKRQPLAIYIRKILCEFGYDLSNGSIKLLCYPRIFGYVFNPLSVYYCYDPSNVLRALVYEVNNTFNERHSYLIEVEQKEKPQRAFSCKKNFYVSPFIDMNATYNFHITSPGDRLTVLIDQHDDNGPLLKASFSGNVKALSDKFLLSLLIRYPLMSVKVIGGIHWEALKLWLKGLKIIKRPNPPETTITLVNKHQTKS